ncbi:Rxlr-like protein, partial [Globisporangium splendens]
MLATTVRCAAAVCAFLSLVSALFADAYRHDESLQRWDFWPPLPDSPYFTGRYLASRPGGIHLIKQRFDAMNLFALGDEDTPTPQNVLLYGSVLLEPIYPASLDTDLGVQAALASAVVAIKKRGDVHVSPDVKVTRAVVLSLKATGDNGESEMVVLHEYRDLTRRLREFKSHVTFGFNYLLTLEDKKFNLVHNVMVGLDREGIHNLFQHTYFPLDKALATSSCATSANMPSQSCEPDVVSPRILSYNVWNTNPSADVYGYEKRWMQYAKRMAHLVRFVHEAKADIIGFQEVRYDGVFGGGGNHAQVQHLADRLPGYQYVYQPAMSYLNAHSPYERIEEGPAVFSKHPIVQTDYLLLSRDPNDPNDSHQRLCLHAVIDVPGWGLIDVYVTHLSLSERSREKTMVEIWKYMRAGEGKTQVLLGDLNAEPQSQGLQFLRGEVELLGETTDLKDAYLEKHIEPEPRSEDPVDRHDRFTFPSDNPVKRIDFILYRGKGKVHDFKTIGQAPTDDTKEFPLDVGMLNRHSPVYASDHRGVVVEFS